MTAAASSGFTGGRQAQQWSKSLDHPAATERRCVVSRTVRRCHRRSTTEPLRSGMRLRASGNWFWKDIRGQVFALAFSPSDPALLVSAGDDRTIRFWDARQRLRTREGERQTVGLRPRLLTRWWTRWCPAGPTRPCAPGTSTPPRERQLLEGHFDFVYCVAISADESMIASSGLDRYGADLGRRNAAICGTPSMRHALEVWSVDFFSGRTDSGQRQRRPNRCDCGTPRRDRRSHARGHTDRVRDVAFSPRRTTPGVSRT